MSRCNSPQRRAATHRSVFRRITAASRCITAASRCITAASSAASPQRHTSKKAWLCFATQPRRCPVSYILTCPPSRALALSAERSRHPARTSHREGRCSPCRSSSLLGSPGIPPCTLVDLWHPAKSSLGDLGVQPIHPARVMAHRHASCDIVLLFVRNQVSPRPVALGDPGKRELKV